MEVLKEFRPSLIFLSKFLVVYLAGNIIYGIYVESFGERADDLTRWVGAQTSWLLNKNGYTTSLEQVAGMPKLALKNGKDVVLYVYEGCNGMNVMIVFVAFLVAFGGSFRRAMVFAFGGILIIHLLNLLRVILLFNLAASGSVHFYYYHKYLFTASLYLAVFCLWAAWVMKLNGIRDVATKS